jgi:hypothetical protein
LDLKGVLLLFSTILFISFIGVLKEISPNKLLEILSFIFSENEDLNVYEDLLLFFGKGELIDHM